MFASTIIVFREVFEIALIISVILAATRGVAYRHFWINIGILGGAATVGVMAFFARAITHMASMLGQHFFHALVLFTAGALISWSVIWMQTHGRQITMQMRELSESVKNNQAPLYMLAVVVGLAVMREGSEIVLFLYGIFAAGQVTVADIFVGCVVGTGLGVLAGAAMYLGLVRLPVKQLFGVSGWLLAFLAAGMFAKGAGHLVAANALPALINPLWDTSTILSAHSFVGRILSILFGYQDKPSAMQVIFYLTTLILISVTLMPKKKV